MKGKVSILVAVYNTEQYLRECLDSLVNQSYRNLQIICIDDASTDGSLAILKEYAEKDDRVLVLHNEENLGQAKTRNHGIRYADGDFATMVDSDDTLALDAIEKVMTVFDAHASTDTVLVKLVLRNEDGTLVPYENRVTAECLSGEDALRASLDWGIHGLYVTRMSIQKEILYDECARFSGDDNTTRLHYYASREVRFSDGEYYWRQHASSISHVVSIRRFDVFVADYAMKEHLRARDVSRELLMIFEQFRWYNVVGLYKFYLDNKALFTVAECQEIERMFNHYAGTIDRSLIPMRLKLKTLYIPFCGARGVKFWVNTYCRLRGLMPSFLLKKRVNIH